MKIALIGLPGSGKTTVFNALTEAGADLRSGGRAETRLAVVHVPDPRVDRLAELSASKKKTYAAIEYADLVGLGEGGRQMDDRFLSGVRDADALLLVIRAFPEAPGAPPPDAAAELESVHADLMVSDLQIIEGRMERLEVEIAKGGKDLIPDRDVLVRCREALEASVPLRALDFEAEDEKRLRGYAFLSAKPLLVVFNTGEDQRDFSLPEDRKETVSQPRTAWTSFCAALEMDLLEMGDQIEEFAREMGVETFSRERVIRMTYDLLGLVTFLTTGEPESRAWPILKGMPAVRAAGAIHSDLERGFIRAETVSYEDLMRAGAWAAARPRGLLRLEGKEYVIQEGDVILFRFKV